MEFVGSLCLGVYGSMGMSNTNWTFGYVVLVRVLGKL